MCCQLLHVHYISLRLKYRHLYIYTHVRVTSLLATCIITSNLHDYNNCIAYTTLVHYCRPETKFLCVKNFSLVPKVSSTPTMDVAIFLEGKIVQFAYPTQRDESCGSAASFPCDFKMLQ